MLSFEGVDDEREDFLSVVHPTCDSAVEYVEPIIVGVGCAAMPCSLLYLQSFLPTITTTITTP